MQTTTKIRPGIAAAVLALGSLCTAGGAQAQELPPGTPVMLQFMETVSTKTSHKGDTVKLRVFTDVVVNAKTLIKQDAPAVGIVTAVKKPGPFGKRAELKMKLESVQDVRGRRVALESYSSGDRFRASGPGASAAGLLVLGPVGLVGGAFVKGKHITIENGTRIQARTPGGPDSDAVRRKKNEVPPVENP